MKALYGDTEEYKAILSKLESTKETTRNIRNRGERIKESLDSRSIDPEYTSEMNTKDITGLDSYKDIKKSIP
jgi:hypothetical protein